MARQLQKFIVHADTTGPAGLDPAGGRVDVSQFDAASIEWVPEAAASSAVLEVKRSYGAVPGQAVAFGTAATLDNTTRRRVALDIADAPMLEIDITTAGSAGARGTLYVYGYTTT